MSVPREAPRAVHEYWAGVPNCAEIYFLFKLTSIGPTVRVRCEAWGQLANDNAATYWAIKHVMNRRPYWWAKYVGWQEVDGDRCGDAPADFREQYAAELARWR